MTTGNWTANDGGLYHLREVGDTLWWVGMHPERAWVNVFRGERQEDGTFEGEWTDVPAGNTGGDGRLRVQPISLAGSPPHLLHAVENPAGFGATEWEKRGASGGTFKPVAFAPRYSSNDLTGGWLGNDGGRYYVRDIGSTVWWFGEHSKGGWSNVFRGVRNGARVSGEWADVPRGNALRAGDLALQLVEPDRMAPQIIERREESGGFGGSRWLRRDPETALLGAFTRLTCREETEGPSDDEPFVIVCSVDLNMNGRRDIRVTRTSLFDDDQSVGKGETRSQNVRIWGTVEEDDEVQPAPLRSPGDAIILAMLMESDNAAQTEAITGLVEGSAVATLAAGMDDDRAALINRLTERMRGAARNASVVEVLAQIIDIDLLPLTFDHLAEARREPVGVRLEMKGDGALYDVDFHFRPAFE